MTAKSQIVLDAGELDVLLKMREDLQVQLHRIEAKLDAFLGALGVEVELRPTDPAAAAFENFRQQARKQPVTISG